MVMGAFVVVTIDSLTGTRNESIQKVAYDIIIKPHGFWARQTEAKRGEWGSRRASGARSVSCVDTFLDFSHFFSLRLGNNPQDQTVRRASYPVKVK